MDDMKAGRLRVNSNEPKISQIEPVDKNVNDTNRIVLVDPILQALRKQRALSSILALNEALHLIPRVSRGNPNSRITPDAAFSHSLGQDLTHAARHYVERETVVTNHRRRRDQETAREVREWISPPYVT